MFGYCNKSTAFITSIGKYWRFCFTAKEAKMFFLLINSTQVRIEPNQASPPTQPPFSSFVSLACYKTSTTCSMIGSCFGRNDASSLYSFNFCWAFLCTILWQTEIQFLTIVPNSAGFLGSTVMFGSPLLGDVLGCHANMDSSRRS